MKKDDISVWYEVEQQYLKVTVPQSTVDHNKYDDPTKPLFFLYMTGSASTYSVTYVVRSTTVEALTASIIRPLLDQMKVAITAVGATLICLPPL